VSVIVTDAWINQTVLKFVSAAWALATAAIASSTV
jgi:hypothetical protein